MDSLHPDAEHTLEAGAGAFRFHHDRGGVDDRFGHLHRRGRDGARDRRAGWMMLAWVIAGVLTLAAALSYGELAAMMPRAGGQYVYLREAFSPLWGFLYGWTLFLVIQTGTIAASSVGFARYLGVLVPFISESHYLIAPIRILPDYAVSLSTAQVVSLCLVAFVTWTNSRGLKYGKGTQNVFTTMKIGTLIGVIVIGCLLGWNAAVVHGNFGHAWTPVGVLPPAAGISPLSGFGIFVGLCTAQIGSLFAADAWNNITFTAGEVRDPARNVPLSLALGTVSGACTLYIGEFCLHGGAALCPDPERAVGPGGGRRVRSDLSRHRRHHHRHRHHDFGLWLHERDDPGGRARLFRHGAGRAFLPPRRQSERSQGAGLGSAHAGHVGRGAGADPHL